MNMSKKQGNQFPHSAEEIARVLENIKAIEVRKNKEYEDDATPLKKYRVIEEVLNSLKQLFFSFSGKEIRQQTVYFTIKKFSLPL